MSLHFVWCQFISCHVTPCHSCHSFMHSRMPFNHSIHAVHQWHSYIHFMHACQSCMHVSHFISFFFMHSIRACIYLYLFVTNVFLASLHRLRCFHCRRWHAEARKSKVTCDTFENSQAALEATWLRMLASGSNKILGAMLELESNKINMFLLRVSNGHAMLMMN